MQLRAINQIGMTGLVITGEGESESNRRSEMLGQGHSIDTERALATVGGVAHLATLCSQVLNKSDHKF